MKTLEQIQPFADLLAAEQKAELIAGGMNWEIHAANYGVHIHMGKKFARVDVGGSGKYMVDLETGTIYGIKAYGVVHRGYVFGTLETIASFHWGGYRAHKKSCPPKVVLVAPVKPLVSWQKIHISTAAVCAATN